MTEDLPWECIGPVRAVMDRLRVEIDRRAQNMAYYRGRADLRQQDVADKCGVSKPAISQAETGKMAPSETLATALDDVFMSPGRAPRWESLSEDERDEVVSAFLNMICEPVQAPIRVIKRRRLL